MMVAVKVRIGEPIEKSLRVLKKKLDKEGTMKIIKERRFYEKPSVTRRNKKKQSMKSHRKSL